ncbi:hypothetical protein D5S17_24820 [Pseudonocardiaceae bacterium YIM PH 21723]|nr:hypothetical protein D5S17_24820 [Pseudonocardiaceae bacterium YIM PH 21723]
MSFLSRRNALLGAAAITVPPSSPGEPKFILTDKRGRQRMLADTVKPPVLHRGKEYPRQGPEGTYLIFNDENGDEKGGIIAASSAASVSVDYPNAQAITMATRWEGKAGAAMLMFNAMPDPELPLEQARATHAIELGVSTADGTMLVLRDTQGRPRITLTVDRHDVPRIQILHADGTVAAQLPG